jgi:hypothetical protein
MTHEEILILIEKEGEDKFSAALRALGYYVQKKQNVPLVDDTLLVTGSIRLLDALGLAQIGIGVIVETPQQVLKVTSNGSSYNIGINYSTSSVQITPNGVASIKFVKGSRVRCHVENSSISREFIVPNTDFDILDVNPIVADQYSNPRPPTVIAIRSDI